MNDTKLNRSQHYIQLVLEIYKRIPNSRKITAKEIQQQLSEVGIVRSERTIQRNLTDIAQFFDDVDMRDKPFGYSRRSRHLLSHGPQEAVLLSLAENYLRYLLPVNLMKTLDTVFNDAKQHLFPTTSNVKERQWLKKVRFVSEGVPLLPPHIDNEIFEKVSYALFHNRYLSLCYTNTNTNLEKKSKEVMPLGLAQQGSRLYLVCRFRGHTNERSLALHRIHKASISTFDFAYPSDFDLERYDLDGRFYFGEGEEIRLSFCIGRESGYHLLETPLSMDQSVELIDGGYQVTATVIDSLQLERWLRGFGDEVWNTTKKECPPKIA